MASPSSPTTEVKRHPLAIAWDEWLASPGNQKAANIDTLPRTPDGSLYLVNRLRSAFLDGATTAQSQLAKAVLAEMSTMAGGRHGGGLVVVARDAAVERLRDLFTQMGIEIES